MSDIPRASGNSASGADTIDFSHAALLYVSDAVQPFDADGITLQAATLNRRDGVTGLLCFDAECVVQYVEGPELAIHSLYGRLQADRRHERMETLMFGGSNGVLRFPSWDMACVSGRHEGRISSLRGTRSKEALDAFEALLFHLTSSQYARA